MKRFGQFCLALLICAGSVAFALWAPTVVTSPRQAGGYFIIGGVMPMVAFSVGLLLLLGTTPINKNYHAIATGRVLNHRHIRGPKAPATFKTIASMPFYRVPDGSGKLPDIWLLKVRDIEGRKGYIQVTEDVYRQFQVGDCYGPMKGQVIRL